MDTSFDPPKRVALKKIKLIKQDGSAPNGLDISAVRELKALRHLSENVTETTGPHPNIAPLLDVWLPSSSNTKSNIGNLHFVLPFYDFDLEALVKDTRIVFTPADIKTWMWMMLSGIEYCHERDIVHRVNLNWMWAFCYNSRIWNRVIYWLMVRADIWKLPISASLVISVSHPAHQWPHVSSPAGIEPLSYYTVPDCIPEPLISGLLDAFSRNWCLGRPSCPVTLIWINWRQFSELLARQQTGR